MPDDLGSFGPIRLPFQFGKGAFGAYLVRQESESKTVVTMLPAVGWDSLGTPTEEFDHG